jgi:hypothetical protein
VFYVGLSLVYYVVAFLVYYVEQRLGFCCIQHHGQLLAERHPRRRSEQPLHVKSTFCAENINSGILGAFGISGGVAELRLRSAPTRRGWEAYIRYELAD